MGLDNIPKNYPCRTKGTAVLEVRRDEEGRAFRDTETGEELTRIDCQATQACGGCPWKNAYEASNLEAGPTTGIFGTDCWYRGKYGNYLLEELTVADPMGDGESFYGDNEDGTEKSPESCHTLADLIDDALAEQFVPEIAADARYAAWWLRWVADEAGGSVCWY